MKALERNGKVNKNDSISLDRPLPENFGKRVRLIVLSPEQDNDISDSQWLKALSKNKAFDVLNDREEDIYSLKDGKPFNGKK